MKGHPTIPANLIRNANPTWIRSISRGSVKDLAASIDKHDMRLPILIKPDYQVIDGARRFVAATEVLKWDHVPVKIADDWFIVHQHYLNAQKLKTEFEDDHSVLMNWEEMVTLIETILKPIHSVTQRRQSVLVRKNKQRSVEAINLAEAAQPSYNGITRDLADMFGLEPSPLKMLRDIYSMLRRYRDKNMSAADLALINELLDTVQRHATPAEAGRVRNAVRELYLRPDYGRIIVRRLITLYKAGGSKFVKQRPHRRSLPDSTATLISSTSLLNLTQLLEQVADQANQMRNFKETPESVAGVVRRLKNSVYHINSLRRRIEASVDPDRNLEK